MSNKKCHNINFKKYLNKLGFWGFGVEVTLESPKINLNETSPDEFFSTLGDSDLN